VTRLGAHEEQLRLQGFLRAIAPSGRDVVRVPPFTAYLDRRDPLRYLSYAIPDDGAEPDARAVDELRVAFRGRARLPRLEWIEEAAPAVEEALAAAGMVRERRTPLMTCAPPEVIEADAAVPGLVIAVVGDDDLRECANLQRAAFGREPLRDDEPPDDARVRGGGAVLARAAGAPG
jgi:hypothetical protein